MFEFDQFRSTIAPSSRANAKRSRGWSATPC